MTVGDEDVAVRRDEHVGRLVEAVGARRRHALPAERHQHRAVGAELEDLLSHLAVAARIGDPQVAVAIDGGAVREEEQPGAKGPEQPAGLVVYEDRRLGPALAGIVGTPVHDVNRAVGRRLEAVTAAHFTPGGSCPQSRAVRYGCGRSFRGAPDEVPLGRAGLGGGSRRSSGRERGQSKCFMEVEDGTAGRRIAISKCQRSHNSLLLPCASLWPD